MDFITTITDRDTWFFRSSTWFNQIHVDGLSGSDGAIFLNGQNIYEQISGNTALLSTIQEITSSLSSVFSTVQTNSALWDESTDITYLSGRIDSNIESITTISFISGNWNSVFSTVQLNSATTWLGDSAVDSLVHNNSSNWNDAYTNLIINSAAYLTSIDLGQIPNVSANWDSTYTTVQLNSADWNYQGSDVKLLSANWESTFTTVCANSALWDESTDINYLSGRIDSNTNNITNISIVSANWNGAYTNLIYNSAAYLTSVNLGNIPAVSANWDSTYTTVCANSAIWDDIPDLSSYATLSGATFTGNVSANVFSQNNHTGYTHSKKIILMDTDGNSYGFYLRGGIITED